MVLRSLHPLRVLSLNFGQACLLVALTMCTGGAVGSAHAAKRGSAQAEADAEPSGDPRFSLAPMLKKVGASVVSIRAYGQKPADPQLASSQPTRSVGKGSGFVLSADGYVVTNHHVIEGADSFEVRLADGRSLPATLVGFDPATDLAVLRVSGQNKLPTVQLGRSEGLEVGDWVVAMGSPLGFEHSASVGIVSARGRGSLGLYADSYLDFLQTDADVAPGSSGGPLFDLNGSVVGITTAVGANDGPGFAIPIDQARTVIDALRKHGEVVRGWLGAGHDSGNTASVGARIDRVYPRTPAANAGLLPGDRVLTIDGAAVETFSQLRWAIAQRPPGAKVKLRVERSGKTITRVVTLGRRPGKSQAAPNTKTSANVQPSSSVSLVADFGVEAQPFQAGMKVTRVAPGSLAARAGLEPGDTLLELDGHTASSERQLEVALASDNAQLELTILRGIATHRISVPR